MTIAYADSVDHQDNGDLIRWAVSLFLVLALHFVAALWLLSREAPVEPNKPPPPAAYLDLPPLPPPGAGITPGTPAPVKPAPIQPTPPKSVKPLVQEVKPIVPPPAPPQRAEVPKVALPPQPSPIPKFAVPLPEAPKQLLPKPQPAKPQPAKPQPAATPEAPPSLTGSAPIVRLSAIGLWQAGVIARIEKFKAWPPEAVRYRLTGVVGLRIKIDRQGNILSYSLAGSTGYPLLDQATLEMARRAQRLPALPPEIPGEVHEFVLSVQWL